MARRVSAVIGSVIFLVLPGVVAGMAPWWISGWRTEAPFFGLAVLRYGGSVLILLGTVGLLDGVRRFAVQGLGTPAPVFPTKHLVVTGLYRHVRNPMYAAVVSTIVGQGLLFGNAGVLLYGVLVWMAFHLFVVIYEEPTLRRSFGFEYDRFCAEVPRWIPRRTAWKG